MQLEFSLFAIETDGPFGGYHAPSETWNGFATPAFTREEGERIAAAISVDENDKLYFDEVQNAFVHLQDGETVVYTATDDGLFPIGAYGWTWSEAEPPSVEALANAFSRHLAGVLDAADLTEAVARNKSAEQGVCHSHDFVDTNMVMDAAVRELCPGLMGYDSEVGMPELTSRLWNDAWSLASSREFEVVEQAPGARLQS